MQSTTCSRCGNLLPIKIAKAGNFPGHPYYHVRIFMEVFLYTCTESSQCLLCGNHFTFAKPVPPASLPQLTPPAHTAVQPLPGLIPSEFPQLPTLAVRTKCANQSCGRAPHRTCSNQMCKQCCIICRGGCRLQNHKPERLSVRQQEKLRVSLSVPMASFSSPSQLLPPLNPPILEAFHGLDPTSASLNHEKHLDEVRRTEEQRQLDLEAREEADYQRAIAQSLDLSYTSRVDIPSPSTSSSVTQKPVRTVPYKTSGITQHMNEAWMRPVEDKTKKPRRLNLESSGNSFTIIFWDEVRVYFSFYLKIYAYKPIG